MWDGSPDFYELNRFQAMTFLFGTAIQRCCCNWIAEEVHSDSENELELLCKNAVLQHAGRSCDRSALLASRDRIVSFRID